jgi:hypothetical protein
LPGYEFLKFSEGDVSQQTLRNTARSAGSATCSGGRGFSSIYRHFPRFEFILASSFDPTPPSVHR